MTQRLVVCLRYAAVECDPQHYLAVARRAEAALAAVGGERIGWGADRYSFELDPDDFPLVLRQMIATQLEHPEHGVGIGFGELTGREEGTVWGRALVVASALASSAKPGEILLDPQLRDVRESRLATLGRVPVRVGERYLGAALLLPGACPATGYRASEDPDAGASRPPLATSFPPPSLSARPSVFDALRSGDPDVMFDLARTLRNDQPENQAAARLEAMALLARGKSDQALEQLEHSARAAADASPLIRAQATLALAVGYARVGESRRAALTAMHALIDARHSGNARAEQACAQLLAQLAAHDGAHDAAQAWQRRSVSA
jgi:hypothetical protein